jgi:hypothetical protein
MKRLLLVLAFTLLPSLAHAQSPNRDMLLTPGGTLYTVDSASAVDIPTLKTAATTVITLRIQQGANTTSTVVPESLTPGIHTTPALAYDGDSDTLFVFWQKAYNMSSFLLFSSYRDGRWSGATSIESPNARVSNLRIGVTRQIDQVQADGTITKAPQLLLHAIWWNDDGASEYARYALLTIDGGNITAMQLHDVSEFAGSSSPNAGPDATTNPELLRHPAIFESAAHDTIDLLWGDLATSTFSRTQLKPVTDARLRIPIGVHPQGPRSRIVAPSQFTAQLNGPVSAVASSQSDRLVFYYSGERTLNYLVYSKGSWSELKSIAIDDHLSYDAAVSVLTRMVAQ